MSRAVTNAAGSATPAKPARIRIGLGPRSYDVLVGEDLLAAAGAFMRPVLKQDRLVVVTDETVAALHLETLGLGLTAAGIAHDSIVLPAGEGTKDFAHLADLVARLLDLRVERDTSLVALGGGVIGDLTGFAAAITLRGIDFVQVPTTLLAQVDSSVGGKTGINTSQGKNLVGSFHQPRLVLADTAVLDTLPRRELRAGYAEVMKYGLIGDAGFFAWLESHGRTLIEGDAAGRRRAIVTSVKAKAAIVAADEREAGQRAFLNLGHTFGHALEAEAGFGDALLHGEAVALGCVLAFRLSTWLGHCPEADAERVRAHVAAMGLPASTAALGFPVEPGRLLEHMRQDKKVRSDRIGFVLVHRIGDAFVRTDVPEDAVLSILSEAAAT